MLHGRNMGELRLKEWGTSEGAPSPLRKNGFSAMTAKFDPRHNKKGTLPFSEKLIL